MKSSLLLRGALQAALDCLFCVLSWKGAILVFSYFSLSESPYALTIQSNIWIMAVFCVLFYMVCGVYKSLWQHPGFGSMLRLAAAALLTSFAIYVVIFMQTGFWANPGIGVMAGYFLFSASLALRAHKKVLHTISGYFGRKFAKEPPSLTHEPVRTLIVGAGDSASAFLLHKNQHGARPREILGIVDSNYRKHGYSLHGVSIMGDDSKIPELVKRLDIDEIVVAVPSMTNEELRRIVKLTPIKRC